MHSLHLFDHAFLILLAVAYPVLGVWEKRRLEAEVAQEREDARLRLYRRGVWLPWLVTICLGVGWWILGRSLDDLGLGLPRTLLHFAGIAAGLALVGWLRIEARMVLDSPKHAERLRATTETIRNMLPRTHTEERWWNALSLTAGVTEEVLYRGFLMAYLGVFMGLWWTVPVSALIFGVAHAYQGGSGVLRTALPGLAFAAGYAVFGQLWGLMIAHAAIDITSGRIGARVWRDGSTASRVPLDPPTA